ncbi:MAG: hypothetical protein OEL75_00130 [Kiritimatiellaceae bacterium]|nr:hypothetical protein [Kiritimatiellaceae bacterium]
MKLGLLLSFFVLLITACGREESTTYQVPKEPVAPAQALGMDSATDNAAVIAAHNAMNAHAPVELGFSSELPEGWMEVPGSGMRKMSYTIEGTSIDFYLIILAMGDVPSNVNRWRGQVALAAATPEEIAADTQTFHVDGREVKFIEIYNTDGGKGIIAAIIDLAPQYWYFTAKGSVAELQANASDIRAFLETITFKGTTVDE